MIREDVNGEVKHWSADPLLSSVLLFRPTPPCMGAVRAFLATQSGSSDDAPAENDYVTILQPGHSPLSQVFRHSRIVRGV